MTEPNLDLHTFEERLKKIEKQNRYLKLSGVLTVLLGLIAGLLGGATYSKIFPTVLPDRIFAKEIYAKTIAASQNISVKELWLLDKGIRACLGVWDNSPTLRFYDKKNNDTASLGVSEDGEAYLSLYNKNGASCISLGFNKYNMPCIALSDDKQITRASLYLGEKGRPAITLLDDKEKPRIGLSLDEVGEPNMTLLNGKGNPRAILGAVSLMEKTSEERTKYPPSSLVLFNEKGMVIWKAPPLLRR